jgi:hypothetical protein
LRGQCRHYVSRRSSHEFQQSPDRLRRWLESQATGSKKAGRVPRPAVALVAALAIGAIGSNGAVAQPVGRAVVDVTPLVADAGVPRVIRVSGTWSPCLCAPERDTVEGGSGDADQLTVRLNVPQTLVAARRSRRRTARWSAIHRRWARSASPR